MINITDFAHEKLSVKSWCMGKGESWCVLGKNGAGKQQLIQLITGVIKPNSVDYFELPQIDKIGVVSFENQQKIYEQELLLAPDDIGTLAKDFLPENAFA